MSRTAAARTMLPPRHWYSDPLSCLQACLGTALLHSGAEPLHALGLRWEFFCQPGRIRREEFYYPCRSDGDVAASIAPFYPVSSRWWTPGAGADPLSELRVVLRGRQPVIAAVDNFYLPFRPAYSDVHAAHLVTVWGVDDERGEVHVLDSTPPAYSGPVASADFLRAWASANPADRQDAFFSDSAIGYRCLLVDFTGPQPSLGRAELAGALRANLSDLSSDDADDPHGSTWAGLAGLRRYLGYLADQGMAGDAGVLADAYPFGWAVQAQTYLHAELLRELGSRWRLPALREAASAVADVAWAWTGVRMTAAHGMSEQSVARTLRRHCDRVLRRYQDAIDALGEAVTEVGQ
ncbi:MAG TPA: BtrH N-terminal domain-containing protein [Streptosporangiaceae bacterium]|nr:BtrH N-terminal domain-containing protein [Streptosporangiaceae bacterium]